MLSRSKVLSAALLAGAALSVMQPQAAGAQLTVKLGGFTTFRAATFDSDAPGATSREFQNEVEIHVAADGKADNGLLYGARIELENEGAGGGIVTDEASVYLGGAWGRLELGDQDGAADQLFVFAPTVGNGQIDEDWFDFAGPDIDTDDLLLPTDTSDSTKITYMTPKIGGLRAGVSYTPQFDSEGQNVVALDPTDPDTDNLYKDLIEAGIGYEREVAGFSLEIGAGYVHGDANDGTEAEDFDAWGVGAQVGYQGFKVGGAYNDNGDSLIETDDPDAKSWNVGVSYEADAWGVAAQYQKVDLPGRDIDIYGLGAAYQVASGLTVGPDLIFFDDDDPEVGDGYVALIAVNLEF
ncbi:porin [Skermanella pratensis]|uniref:porin n=1 Tax=Skermanella pratensis TaxID=2233999 RepID=UPI0013016605|nr:porin [Skermanella pratensis]